MVERLAANSRATRIYVLSELVLPTLPLPVRALPTPSAGYRSEEGTAETASEPHRCVLHWRKAPRAARTLMR